MGHGKRARSTAQNVDAAWKRVRARMQKHTYLPMEEDACDWEQVRFTAADSGSKLTQQDLMDHKRDLYIVRKGLGRIPPLDGVRRQEVTSNPFMDDDE